MKLNRKQERYVVEQCAEWYKESFEGKEPYSGKDCSKWDLLERYYHWGSDMESQVEGDRWWMADVRVNLINSRINRILGLYTGERPQVTFDPQEPDDTLLAEYITDICQNDWDNGGYDRQLREAMTDACVLGTGFWKTWFDVIAGRVRVSRVSPRSMIVDPNADSALLDCEFVGEAGEISLAKLLAMYGKKFEEEGDEEDYIPIVPNRTYALNQPLPSLARFAKGLRTYGFSQSDHEIPPSAFRAPVIMAQFFLREVGSMPWVVDAAEASDLKKKADSWIITVAGNRVMSVKPHVTRREGWHPYDVFRIGSRPSSFWGSGDVYGLVSIQDGLDTILSRVCQHTQIIVNPQWAVAERSKHLLGGKLEARPGKQWTVVEPSDLVALRPPPLGGEVLGVIQLLVSLLDDRSGVNESVQGRRQAGVTSGKQEETLQRQFAERNKPRLDDRNETIKHWGRRYADLILAVYSEKHVKRVLGKDEATDWDRLKKEAAGGFDLRVGAAPGIDSDPETTANIVVQQLLPTGLLGDPADPKTQMRALQALHRVIPGITDDKIRELRKQLREQRNANARNMVEGGVPPPVQAGAAPAPSGPPVAPPMPPSPPPMEPQLAGAPV